MWRLSLVGLCLIFGFAYTDNRFQCKDEDGNSVDWFVMYKINKQSASTNELIRVGEAYVYITNNTVATGWRLTTKGVNSKTAMLSYTLSPIYDTGNVNRIHVLYNDQNKVHREKTRLGHAKGVLLTNEDGGLWLVHSVPKFPVKIRQGYEYRDNGKVYGQSFLCISVKSDQIEKIANQLYFNQVITYDSRSTPILLDKYPTLVKVIHGEVKKGDPPSSKETIYSARGVAFISFAKTDYWHKDLYHDYVAPELKNPLNVRTWRGKDEDLATDCTNYAVYNVFRVKIPGAGESFKSSQDHSKWAISAGQDDDVSNEHWVCIGDINRERTQRVRGGGTVCVSLPQLWENFNNLLDEVEECH